MKISYYWLKKYLPALPSPEKTANILTQLGLEVAKLTPFQLVSPQLVIGHVLTCIPHPQADKLKKTTVDIGTPTPLAIICGASNVAVNQKVIVAPIGTTLSLPKGEHIKIKKAKIRGEVSEGMICAEEELGLAKTQEGILVLNTKYPPGTPATTYFNASLDTILDIELTPNRADAFSHIGIARELAAFLQEDLEDPLLHPLISSDILSLQIAVENPKACPRYTAVIMKNIKVSPSPVWLQKKLKAIGVTPINNVVDITNFVMYELGQPLHAFDYTTIASKKITIKNLPKKSSFTGLDGMTRELNGEELMICDKKGPIAMAGIIGGENSKITSTTQTILLESAYFDPSTIARTSRHHRLSTEASFRFERGTDPELPHIALQRAVNLLQKIAEGTLASEVIEHYPQPIKPAHIPITYSYINTMIGVPLSSELIHNLLERLDITIEAPTTQGFTAIVPAYRVDVTRPADLVEEMLRLYGYDNLPEETAMYTPYLLPNLAYEKHVKYKRHARDFLVAQGYLQIITNPITHSAYSSLVPTLATKKKVYLANPLNEKLDSLRTTLLFSGLEVISHNLKHGQSNLRLFEMGKMYDKEQEQEKLAIWLVGDKEEPNWIRKSAKLTLQDLYSIVEALLHKYHINQWHTQPLQHEAYQACLDLSIAKQPLLQMGMLDAKLLNKMEITTEVLFAEIDLKTLFAHTTTTQQYVPIAKYPFIKRDVSIAVDQHITFENIRSLIQGMNCSQIKTFYLVDFYQGASLETQQRSYTIRFVLQDTKKTLKDRQANALIEQLIAVLTQELGATLRE